MKNFEQIRAKNALDAAHTVVAEIEREHSDGKRQEEEKKSFSSACKKVPTMILDNGILAAAAFALEKDKDKSKGKGYADVFDAVIALEKDKDKSKGKGYADVFDAVVAHLADPEIGLLDKQLKPEDFIGHLAAVPSDELRRITAETMAYLNYLRRFA
ncbi:MAG: type III-B CRISPR module-associated protein Cmr5 [Candidatus Spyradosoma sp.]